MSEPRAPGSSIIEPLAQNDYITIPVKDIALTKQLYVSIPRGKIIFQTNLNWATLGENQASPSFFSGNLQQPKTRAILTTLGTAHCLQGHHHTAFKPEGKDLMAWQPFLSFDTDNTPLSFYHQRWKQEIYNRFREARKRFPEFFPCFELKYNLVEGLQYSIYFKPLTRYAETLTCNAPLFPNHKEFKPIKQLWNENGQSELDIIFERFPTQLALKPLKAPWWKTALKLVNQGLDFKHIGSLLARKNA